MGFGMAMDRATWAIEKDDNRRQYIAGEIREKNTLLCTFCVRPVIVHGVSYLKGNARYKNEH